MATAMAPQELHRRAIARALAQGGAAAVRRVRYGLYRVESATRAGMQHTVSVDARGVYRCSCECGLAGRPCWHQAAVLIAKVEHASKGRVTGPSATPGAPAAPVQRIEAPANVIDLRARRAA
jgi:SWIM zinc finger